MRAISLSTTGSATSDCRRRFLVDLRALSRFLWESCPSPSNLETREENAWDMRSNTAHSTTFSQFVLHCGVSVWMARLRVLFGGKLMGEDQFGNKYYEKGARRMVMYNGLAESSKVPPLYHGWLHGGGEFPGESEYAAPRWLKPHLPNLSGTGAAYYPKRHPSQSLREAASGTRMRGSYNSWNPS